VADTGQAAAGVTVVVRARLRGDPTTARQLHDQVTSATRELALEAGDISHHVFLDPTDPSAFLGIDVWKSAEAAMAFAGNPRITEFFGQLFDGQPEVTLWVPSDWNEW
jgi:quinol monooxygenase YgiN